MQCSIKRAIPIALALDLCACGWIAGLDEFVLDDQVRPDGTAGSGGEAGAGGGASFGGAEAVSGAATSGSGGLGGALGEGAAGTGGCPDCTPQILVTGQNVPYAITLDESHVYWMNYGDHMEANGSIGRVPKVGGEPVTVVSALPQPNSIAVDGANVYWSTHGNGNGAVARVPKVGGAPVALATGQSSVGNVQVFGDYVYWTTYVGSGLILRTPAWQAGSPDTVVHASDSITGFAVDASSVTWLNWSQKEVTRSPFSGSPPIVIASVQGNPRSVVVDADNAYWVTEGPYYVGAIMQGPLNGGSPPIILVPELPEAQAPRRFIAMDGNFVYWTDRGKYLQSNGRVGRIPIGGGDVEILAGAQGGPLGIAVDDSAVYWTNVDDGTVRKMMKP